MNRALRLGSALALSLLGACTTVPSGPGVMALPGTGKSFDQFRADDFDCRQFANSQVGGTTANQAASDSGVKSAAVGTLIGAAAGAIIDGSSGAAVGAGTGLAFGALAGAGTAQDSAYILQRRYDFGYIQCMYARGHKVPVSGQLMSSNLILGSAGAPPPPPAGSPPTSPPEASAAPSLR